MGIPTRNWHNDLVPGEHEERGPADCMKRGKAMSCVLSHRDNTHPQRRNRPENGSKQLPENNLATTQTRNASACYPVWITKRGLSTWHRQVLAAKGACAVPTTLWPDRARLRRRQVASMQLLRQTGHFHVRCPATSVLTSRSIGSKDYDFVCDLSNSVNCFRARWICPFLSWRPNPTAKAGGPIPSVRIRSAIGGGIP